MGLLSLADLDNVLLTSEFIKVIRRFQIVSMKREIDESTLLEFSKVFILVSM